MKFSSKSLIVCAAVFLSACSTVKDHKDIRNDSVYKAVAGTKTVVVGLPLDGSGAPDKKIEKFEIIMAPGQKVVFAGPEKFSIFFKERKSPVDAVETGSKDGVVIIKIPRDILDNPKYQEELKNNGSLVFNYGVNVNGKIIDPRIIIVRE